MECLVHHIEINRRTRRSSRLHIEIIGLPTSGVPLQRVFRQELLWLFVQYTELIFSFGGNFVSLAIQSKIIEKSRGKAHGAKPNADYSIAWK